MSSRCTTTFKVPFIDVPQFLRVRFDAGAPPGCRRTGRIISVKRSFPVVSKTNQRQLMPVRSALHRLCVGAFIACACTLMAVQPAAAQSSSPSLKAAPAKSSETTSGYNQPPKNILDVMLAPSLPVPRVSPPHDSILLVSWQEYPSIARVATPFLRLAGVRVEPKNHSKHDTPGGYGITPCATAFSLVHVAEIRPRPSRSHFPPAPAPANPSGPPTANTSLS